MPSIVGDRVLIVGGARGIGREICRQLTPNECQLIVADLDSAALAALSDELKSVDHASTATSRIALRSPTRCDGSRLRSASSTRWSFPQPSTARAPAEFMTDDFIDRVIGINLVAHVKLVRDVLPLVNDGGKIVGLSSNCADIGIPMESLYAASKAGLERLYEALSIEISYRNIKPIIIHPGNVNTGFNETGNDYAPSGNSFVDDGYRRVIAAIDSRNGIAPEVVARTVVRALTSANPRYRYIVGMNARKAHWAKRLLGTDLALRVMARFFGFKFFY